MNSARQQVRDSLTAFILKLQKSHGLKITTGLVHALREFAVEMYELGRQDLFEANTLPAPRKEESEPPAGSYLLSSRRKPDKV
jgi:hypothetical protein